MRVRGGGGGGGGRLELVAGRRRGPRRSGRLLATAPTFGWGLLRRLGELDGDVGGDVGAAAAALRGRPGVWVQELAAVVAAVGHAGAVEGGVRPVQLLLSVAFHEEVDGHHSCTLRETPTRTRRTSGLKGAFHTDTSMRRRDDASKHNAGS